MKTVKEMAKLTGVSIRTIQYYDKIGLLTPSKKTASGYRLYSDSKLFQLQQILFYKEIGLSLKEIQKSISEGSSNNTKELIKQKFLLLEKKKNLETMITQIDLLLEGGINMDFESFKKTLSAKFPDDVSAKEKETVLDLITTENVDTIKETWGIDKFFDFLNTDSTLRKDMSSFVSIGNTLISKILTSTNQAEQTKLITEWMTLISEYTQIDFNKIVASMKKSYQEHQLTIDSVNTKFGPHTNQKLSELLTVYEKNLN
jgi:DNA-binding transcriptional MerR regulator